MTTDNTLAFISRNAFEINGLLYDSIVTATHQDGRLEIAIQALDYSGQIKVLIDEQDLESVNALLRAQAEVEADDDLAPAPDGSRVLVRAEGWDHLLGSLVAQATEIADEEAANEAA